MEKHALRVNAKLHILIPVCALRSQVSSYTVFLTVTLKILAYAGQCTHKHMPFSTCTVCIANDKFSPACCFIRVYIRVYIRVVLFFPVFTYKILIGLMMRFATGKTTTKILYFIIPDITEDI